jgi:phosphatidylglycerophosphate synthase
MVAAVITAAASRYPLARSAPVNAASAQAPITALYALLIAAGIVFLTGLVVVVWPGRRGEGDEEPQLVSEPPQVHWLGKLLAILVPFALAAALVTAVLTGAHALRGTARFHGVAVDAPSAVRRPPAAPTPAGKGFVLPGWLPWSVLGIILVGIVAGVSVFVFVTQHRAGAPEPDEERLAARRAVDAAITALDGETEPRAAVIAAYAAMQDTLAAEGIQRAAAEAPREYLHRVLLAGTAVPGEAGTLTALFEEARFSAHPISPGMRDTAGRTLASVRARLVAEGAR